MSFTALVVDDDPKNMMLERDILELAGFIVYEAYNATIGIEIAKKEKPDVIIMDMRLPDMRGSAAARILRKDTDTSNIFIVFVTASVMAGGREETGDITNAGFIGKPINTRTFANEIKNYLKIVSI